jgi:hypothetical protein
MSLLNKLYIQVQLPMLPSQHKMKNIQNLYEED